jgi:hypothetical protein
MGREALTLLVSEEAAAKKSQKYEGRRKNYEGRL